MSTSGFDLTDNIKTFKTLKLVVAPKLDQAQRLPERLLTLVPQGTFGLGLIRCCLLPIDFSCLTLEDWEPERWVVII